MLTPYTPVGPSDPVKEPQGSLTPDRKPLWPCFQASPLGKETWSFGLQVFETDQGFVMLLVASRPSVGVG